MIYASRLGMTNKYAYDYACDDEFFEREMTMYEAKSMHLPLSDKIRHKELPYNEIMPAHWNDVRFNYKPENLDRRAFIHDLLPIFYNMQEDFHHTTGFPDEDLDYELPDPYGAMHFKIKRSGVFMMLGAVISCAVVVGYPTLGLKLPQTGNPFVFRKKFGSTQAIQLAQEEAMLEYGGEGKNMD